MNSAMGKSENAHLESCERKGVTRVRTLPFPGFSELSNLTAPNFGVEHPDF